MAERPLVYEHRIQVRPEHIDGMGHVNNVIYLQWVQDAVSAHWQASALPEHQAALAWVVLRHEIDYAKPAFEGEAVVARTWVGVDKGVRYERFVEIVRPQDGAVLARARTEWCALDRVTLRPRRVDKAVRAPFVEVAGDEAETV